MPQGPTVRAVRASGTCWARGVPHVVLPELLSRTWTVTGSLSRKACLGAATLRTTCRALQFSKATWAERVIVGALAAAAYAALPAAPAVAVAVAVAAASGGADEGGCNCSDDGSDAPHTKRDATWVVSVQ